LCVQQYFCVISLTPPPPPSGRGVFTIAIGKKFIRQAKYLALSCLLRSPQTLRAVITDCDELKQYYDIIIPYTSDFGDPFSLKTKLHLYTPFKKTVFIDSDCLIYNNLESYWSDLKNRSFSYFGTMATEGTWYGTDIQNILKKSNISWLPKFNSGMFLFREDDLTTRIFACASNLCELNNIGIPFFRGAMLPDEPFLAIALSKYDQKPTVDFGRYARSLINVKKPNVDIIKGITNFVKSGESVHPFVVHFAGSSCKDIYLRERIKLFLYFYSPFDYLIINTLANFVYCLIVFYRVFRYFLGTTLHLKKIKRLYHHSRL
jgi:hypothetical protein